MQGLTYSITHICVLVNVSIDRLIMSAQNTNRYVTRPRLNYIVIVIYALEHRFGTPIYSGKHCNLYYGFRL